MSKFFDNIINRIFGKRIVLLGERSVGKTVLSTYLAGGEVPTEYIQTLAPEPRSPNSLKLADLKLRLKAGTDVSGDETAYGPWKSLHDKANIVFYLFRTDRVLGNGVRGHGKSTRERVVSDLGQIRRWRRERAPSFVLIGSYCDKVSEYKNLPQGEFHSHFASSQAGRQILLDAGGLSTPLVLGRLDTASGRQQVVGDILKHLNNR